MVIELIIVAIFLIIGLSFLKFDHHARKVKIVAIVIIGFLIYFSIIGIFSSEKVDLSNPRGVVSAVYIYFGWIGQTASNLWDVGTETVHMVGNAIKVNNTDDR